MIPPVKLSPSEYAENNVRIPIGNKIPGYIRFDNAPYQREPLDMIADPGCHTITLMWGAQTGKTQVMTCALAYHIDHDPASQMVMQPSQGDLLTWLETKFNAMVLANESLSQKLAKPRAKKDGVNNQRMKSYPGGWLMFSWSGSAKTMRGRSAPKIYCDEIDGYERTDEGDPISLLSQRAATFGDQKLLVQTSTPTIKGCSAVETAFQQGDQRRFFLPCPHCGHEQTLKWGQVKWDKVAGHHAPDTARYICERCKRQITDADKLQMLQAGKWIAEKPFVGHASYHLNELYSSFRKFSDVVRSFLDKKAKNDLQSFINISLAETWEEAGEVVEHHNLYIRREHYTRIPEKAVVLVCGVDTQDDRIEGEVIAFAEGFESWGIDNFVLHGDPSRPELWAQLDKHLSKSYEHETFGMLPISATCIDSGGHYTQQVYDFCKPRYRRRIWPVKGVNITGRAIASRPSSTNKAKIKLFPVNAPSAKELIFAHLNIVEPGPGYCHFPQHYDEEFFRQLTAEKRVTRFHKGFPRYEWVKQRPRNEALDCRVYAYAALIILDPAFSVIRKSYKPQTVPEPAEPEESAVVNPVNAAKKSRGVIRRNGYVNRWR